MCQLTVSARRNPPASSGGFPLVGGVDLKLLESALFRLALSGAITVEEAKVLKAVWENHACSEHSLLLATGLEKPGVRFAVDSLRSRGILASVGAFYFAPNLEFEICRLIDSCSEGSFLMNIAR